MSDVAAICFFLGMIGGVLMVIAMILADIARHLKRRD